MGAPAWDPTDPERARKKREWLIRRENGFQEGIHISNIVPYRDGTFELTVVAADIRINRVRARHLPDGAWEVWPHLGGVFIREYAREAIGVLLSQAHDNWVRTGGPEDLANAEKRRADE